MAPIKLESDEDKRKGDKKQSDLFKSGTPSSSSSSPVQNTRSYSNISSGTPFSSSSSPIGSGSSSSGGCFIATVAFGSPVAKDVMILKSFRDQHLIKYWIGRSFVNQYYKYSPKASEYISEKPFLKRVVRSLLLPITWLCKQFIH